MNYVQANLLETALHEALERAAEKHERGLGRGIGMTFHYILTVVHGYSDSAATDVVVQWCANWVAEKPR